MVHGVSQFLRLYSGGNRRMIYKYGVLVEWYWQG